MATVPSPSGLGYVLVRLRRSGADAVDSGPAHWYDRLGISELTPLTWDLRIGAVNWKSAN
jgi:hypothetical protein